MTDDVISKLKNDSGDIAQYLHNYKGKVYWGMGGIGDGPTVNYRNAKVISSKGDTTTIQLQDIDGISGMLSAKITVTVKYNEETSSFKITNCTITNM